MTLDTVSQRVLGSLMEKEMTTPELYPLSLNALVAACNQRSSREPVLDLTAEEVRSALDGLEVQGLVSTSRDSRVPRFEHRIRTVLSLRRDETALLCLLLLRGAQTAGELRSRADRMFAFEEIAAVQSALDRLAARERPLAMQLARAPGSREARFAHRLGEQATAVPQQPSAGAGAGEELREQVRTLEERIAALEGLVTGLVERLGGAGGSLEQEQAGR